MLTHAVNFGASCLSAGQVTIDEAAWRDFFSSTGGTATLPKEGNKQSFVISGKGKHYIIDNGMSQLLTLESISFLCRY